MPQSRLTMDVSGSIDVTDPAMVSNAVLAIFQRRYPGFDFSLIERLYKDFAALYRGELEGFFACDTGYHDIQHVLDVSLAMARLIDGYDASQPEVDQLGPELALIGLIVVLFHDSGYIRRKGETGIQHGAEYTKVHVSRSAQFMAEYLPSVNRGDIVELTGKLVHFTGYEFSPDQIELDNDKQRVVGSMAGTADVIAQMADPAYLEKCRDHLYPEFQLGGMTRQQLDDGTEQVVYASAEDLLLKTPSFIKSTITQRLDGHFKGLYHYVAPHFGGRNLYMEALENNCRHLETLIAENDLSLLSGASLRP
ncbi:MAG: hypothetical protein GY712_11010 [Oceanicoccus sp.]|uniref:hypothetical protein n=1 Tax=Oceanicoccus sp. TaxID=2691044 RepID=UPI0026093A81|nr:hypothetical protein [Oceanicoccus sp.]MCP3908532.1 hypothetical protein [Oceanicoccus sp.]MDG1773221.1 hypothetical protein [Oceanicoccus sp.]